MCYQEKNFKYVSRVLIKVQLNAIAILKRVFFSLSLFGVYAYYTGKWKLTLKHTNVWLYYNTIGFGSLATLNASGNDWMLLMCSVCINFRNAILYSYLDVAWSAQHILCSF